MMRKRFARKLIIMITFLSLVFPCSSEASRTTGKFGLELRALGDRKTASDCNFMYLLTKDKIIKFSLPELTRISSVDLPLNTEDLK